MIGALHVVISKTGQKQGSEEEGRGNAVAK